MERRSNIDCFQSHKLDVHRRRLLLLCRYVQTCSVHLHDLWLPVFLTSYPFLINSIAQTRPEMPAPRMSTFLPFPSAVILGGAVMVDVIARSQLAMVAIIADVPATIPMRVKKSRFVKIVLSVI